jgi:hypothetical protein
MRTVDHAISIPGRVSIPIARSCIPGKRTSQLICVVSEGDGAPILLPALQQMIARHTQQKSSN